MYYQIRKRKHSHRATSRANFIPADQYGTQKMSPKNKKSIDINLFQSKKEFSETFVFPFL